MLSGMIQTPLKIISSIKGDVFQALKVGDPGFSGFGDVYFSTVKLHSIKAWKRHRHMTLNLIVPVGSVLFGFVDERYDLSTAGDQFSIILSQEPYFRLTVPPGIWFGFKGLDAGLNLVANVANMPHDPEEVERKALNEIQFDWKNE